MASDMGDWTFKITREKNHKNNNNNNKVPLEETLRLNRSRVNPNGTTLQVNGCIHSNYYIIWLKTTWNGIFLAVLFAQNAHDISITPSKDVRGVL